MSGTHDKDPAADFRPVLLVPHYNHARQFLESLPALRRCAVPILVVDDGSDPAQRQRLDAAAAQGDFELLKLPVNRGKGEAVMAGFDAALAAGYSHALQLDADGQHDPADIRPFLAAAAERPDTMVCGAPLFGDDAPWVRVWGRKLTDLVVLLETWTGGIRDSLCGFRVYPLAATVATIKRHRPGARMDFDAELLVNACWAHMPLHFIDTRVRYPESGVSHFRYLRDNARMVAMHTRLLLRMMLRSPVLLADRLRGRGPRVSAPESHPLAALVPHRPPMLLLDELLDGDGSRARAAFTVRANDRLLDGDRGLPAWALLEHFAQTAALIGGLKAREAGTAVGQGFLLGTRKLACPVSHIPVGTRLVLEAETSFVDGNGMGAYHCRCVTDGYPISCTLTVYTPAEGSENHE